MFAQIALSKHLPYLPETLTYQLSPDRNWQRGELVIVPFGKNRRLSGFINEIRADYPNHLKTTDIKPVLGSLEKYLDPRILDLSQEISNYYQSDLHQIWPLFIPPNIWNGKWKNPSPPQTSQLFCTEHLKTLTEEQDKALEQLFQ
ncbi:MAG TPA: hypothetical protein PLQ36_01795, partial [Candidatus Gracilibacteria bacterium]|nr:hypothetical protein [Candidatus Gracilibacteria bacterium]